MLSLSALPGDEPPPTGWVSRSGRIRKKSSKLRDYQSPDDWDVAGASSSQPSSSKKANRNELPPPPPDHPPDSSTTPEYLEDDYEDTDQPNVLPNRSIYMSEKSSKNRVVMSDGSVQLVRQPRKDKGRTRMTAYMLWARSVRGQLEDLSFTAKSQRLGELWANVSAIERMQWKKRVAAYNRNTAKQAKTLASNEKQTTAANSKFLNKSSKHYTGGAQRAEATSKSGRRSSSTVASNIPVNKVMSVDSLDPVNIAAHLKLLGDSLSNIGESLEQHEDKGHNSITGTVSVLLDSLLCSVVPLISLTTQIEGFGHRVAHMKDTFQNTLDNIAYVMPGLPF